MPASGLNIKQFRSNVLRPVLDYLGLHSSAAEQLLIGTAAQESRFEYLRQLNDGPALGVFQMEPKTHDDIHENYLRYKPQLGNRVLKFAGEWNRISYYPTADEMCGNLFYAAAMCRIHYLRVQEALPEAGDVWAMGNYWKKYYNTYKGAGKVSEFVLNFPKLED